MPDQPAPPTLPEEALRELKAAFEERYLEFEDLQFQQQALGYDIFGHASWEERPKDKRSSLPSYRLHRTFVFFYRPGITLPESVLYTRSTSPSGLLGPLSRLLGMPTCKLEGEEQFNSAYGIGTATPGSIRALLTRQAIDALVTVRDAYIVLKPRGILFMRHQKAISRSSIQLGPLGSQRVRNADQRITGNDLQAFLDDAVTACSAIVNDPDAGRRAANAVEGTFAEEGLQNLTSKGGYIGHVLSKHLVTHQMLETLRHQPTPRSGIPGPIRKLGWQGNTTFLMTALSLMAAISVIVSLSIRNSDASWWVPLLFSLGACAGIAVTCCYRAARKRLVIHGHAIPGVIAAVEPTNDTINSSPIYRIVVQPQPGGSPIETRMPKEAAMTARRFMEQGRETWVLVDPRKPRRATWPEGWSLEALPD